MRANFVLVGCYLLVLCHGNETLIHQQASWQKFGDKRRISKEERMTCSGVQLLLWKHMWTVRYRGLYKLPPSLIFIYCTLHNLSGSSSYSYIWYYFTNTPSSWSHWSSLFICCYQNEWMNSWWLITQGRPWWVIASILLCEWIKPI